MQTRTFGLFTAGVIVLAGTVAYSAPEKDPLKPRVPAAQLDEAKKLTTPLFKEAKSAPAKVVEEGKALYEGKGTCFNCHGKSGKGDGMAGAMLDPGPRDFTNCAFQKARTDGELLWTVKNGIQGTGMVSLSPAAVSEEEAWKIIAYVRSFCK
ncbi:MAG TPA: cytochrome c [Nitrospira sp.]|nr:cytochrome c [Nitrospira sp.]